MNGAISRFKTDKITWNLTLITLLFAAFLPEYIAPIFTLVNFLLFKRHFKVTGQKVKMGTLGKAFIIYMCYMLVSFIWSGNKVYSVLIALLWMGMLLGEMFTANLVTSKERLNTALLCLSVGAAIVSVIGILQMVFRKAGVYFPIPFWKDLDHAIFSFLPFTIETKFVTTRASATFDNPLILATYLLLIFPTQIYSVSQEKNKKRLSVHIICMLLTFAALLLTYSRGAYIAVTVSIFIMAFLGWKYAVTLTGVGLAIILFLPQSVWNRINHIVALDVSTITRLDIWSSLLSVFNEHPILGIGAGTEGVTQLLHNRFEIMQPHAHSLYLELAIEGGLIGLILFFVAVGIIIYDSIYLMRNGRYWFKLGLTYLSCIVGFLLFSIFEFTMQTPKELQFFMLYLGFVEATKRLCKKEKEGEVKEIKEEDKDVVVTE